MKHVIIAVVASLTVSLLTFFLVPTSVVLVIGEAGFVIVLASWAVALGCLIGYALHEESQLPITVIPDCLPDNFK